MKLTTTLFAVTALSAATSMAAGKPDFVFIDDYFATYSGISYYMLHIKEVAREQGFVTTLLGRKRFIPELNSPVTRAMGERMAINMPIQGTAADIVKIAMIRLDERLRAGGFRNLIQRFQPFGCFAGIHVKAGFRELLMHEARPSNYTKWPCSP